MNVSNLVNMFRELIDINYSGGSESWAMLCVFLEQALPRDSAVLYQEKYFCWSIFSSDYGLFLSVDLQVSVPPGALDCWVFLSCLEVLQRIEGCCDRAQIDANVSHTVGLWSYATEKVSEWCVEVVVSQCWSRKFVSLEQILSFLLWNLILGSVHCLESSLGETSMFISTFSSVIWGLGITRVCPPLFLAPLSSPLIW